MNITMEELMMIRQAVSTVALENDWDKAKEEDMFHQTVAEVIKSQVKISRKKRHK